MNYADRTRIFKLRKEDANENAQKNIHAEGLSILRSEGIQIIM